VTGEAAPTPIRPFATATARDTESGIPGDQGRRIRRGVAYAFLIGYALLMFVPFAWTVITSFKTQPDALQMTIIPDPFSLQGWEHAFTQLKPPLPRLFLNSAIVAIAVTASNVFLGAMAGYAFARLRFPGRDILFLLVLGTLMIPDQLRMVPIYQLLQGFGLLKGELQYGGLWLVLAINAASIFLLRQYFLTIPRDLEEAAKLDGAGFFRTFWKVMLPLAGPALAAVAILQFQGTWNNFFWPLVILQQRDFWTLPLGLTLFKTQYFTIWPDLMAVVVMATIPILLLYLFFQRYFVEGAAASGVKG
jgi:multiple sugar transport system permease protein